MQPPRMKEKEALLVFNAYLLQILVLSAIGIGIGLIVGGVLPMLGLWLLGDRLNRRQGRRSRSG